MKILVIMKRFGANKDMVIQNFGRQVRIFENISEFGHKVDFICPDYKKHENKDVNKNGINYYIRPYSVLNHFRFARELGDMIRKNKYDIIVGTTEPLIGIMGYFYSKRFGIKYIYDMQDEYSHYDSYKIPFVRHFDRKALKDSDIVLAVSHSLHRQLRKLRKKPICTIQNGINLKEFKRMDKKKAKKILKLPKGKIIIYIGEISRLKGVDVLIEAFKEVRKQVPDSCLLLSGKILDSINVKQDGIIYEEYPKRLQVITALNAADVAVLPNRKNIFSEYCFPYKLLEYMAVGLPIVATDIGDTSLILSKFKSNLCKPDNEYDMAEKLIYALKINKKPNYQTFLKNMTWESLAKKLDKIIIGLQK